jgi:hypothetical protein
LQGVQALHNVVLLPAYWREKFAKTHAKRPKTEAFFEHPAMLVFLN